MTYSALKEQLEALRLFFTNQHWEIIDGQTAMLTATIGAPSRNDMPTSRKVAVHEDLTASGKSPDELAENFWRILTDPAAKILLGSYKDYHSKLLVIDGYIEQVPLSEGEKIAENCPF